MLAGRVLDVAMPVRCCLFRTLSLLGSAPPHTLGLLLWCGLRDMSPMVRAECYSMVRTWISREREPCDKTESAFLKFLGRLAIPKCSVREAAAQAVVEHAITRQELQPEITACVQALLVTGVDLSAEQLLVARVATTHTAGMWDLGEEGPTNICKRALAALEAGNTFHLRQLLLVLLSSNIEEPAAGGILLSLSAAILLRAPLEQGPSSDEASLWASGMPEHDNADLGFPVLRLAVALARKVAYADAGGTRDQHQCGQSKFLTAMLGILRVVRKAPVGKAAKSQMDDDAFETLSARTDQMLEEMQQFYKAAVELRARTSELLSADDQLTACVLQERLVHVERVLKEREAAVELAARDLAARTQRLLGIIEAVLCYSGCDLKEDFQRSGLLEEVLRPALVRADRVPEGFGGLCWASLRALAIRCVALYASLSGELALRHWPFFTSVLARYIPLAVAERSPNQDIMLATEAVIEQSVAFLSDTLLLHVSGAAPAATSEYGDASGELADGAHALAAYVQELHVVMLPLLTPRCAQVARGRRSQRLHGKIAGRICSLLLFLGAPQGATLSLAAGPRWALTWLLLEAFVRGPMKPPAQDLESGQSIMVAVLRGQLLRFFSCLARLSTKHAEMLAMAMEGIILLGFWQLGHLVQLGAGQHWCALPLPRLIRFFGHELVAAIKYACVAANEVAGWWLDSLWRPLVITCLESGSLAAASEAQLPQSLIAAVMCFAPDGGNMHASLKFECLPEELRPMLLAEISWVLNRVVELWSSDSSTVGTVDRPGALLELRDLAAEASLSSPVGQVDWAGIYNEVNGRRLRLQRSVAKLGINVRSVVASFVQQTATHSSQSLSSAYGSLTISTRSCPVQVSAVRAQRKRAAHGVDDDDSDHARGGSDHKRFPPSLRGKRGRRGQKAGIAELAPRDTPQADWESAGLAKGCGSLSTVMPTRCPPFHVVNGWKVQRAPKIPIRRNPESGPWQRMQFTDTLSDTGSASWRPGEMPEPIESCW